MTINALNLITKTASCSVMGDYAIKHKMTVPYSKAKKGDIVLYDFNHNGTSDHTGIIYKVEGGKIYVVEGNTSTGNNCNGGMVMKRVRTKSGVNYIVRPKYDQVVTADMVVATALSQVGVKESPAGSNKVKYNTWFYGKVVSGSAYPWCMVFVCWCFAHVGIEKEEKKKEEIKAITKPTGKYNGTIPNPTLKKGDKGDKVKSWQKFLNWYGKFGIEEDGDFGSKTDKATKVFQKTEGFTGKDVDGIVGNQTYTKASFYKEKPKPVEKPKQTNAEKLVATAKELAWPKGTPTKKYAYKIKGSKPTAKMITALKKRGFTKRIDWSDCGKVLDAVIYTALGITTRVLKGVHESFPKVSGFEVVWQGKPIPSGVLKPGDIIRYKKKKKKKIKSQHTLMYIGNNDLAEGGRGIRFFVIKHFKYLSKAKFNKKNVAFETLQVLRVKE